ncbi:unnamed protein product [Symbiodinium necroappetens]|uniref:Uncharacterized protein n=1 Tax=Symbiodinium necroappetens TaxID=1628268 RepID=A0A812XSN6_9DINO|nr:unnamed protein product [Symbiodinium necroappetens]
MTVISRWGLSTSIAADHSRIRQIGSGSNSTCSGAAAEALSSSALFLCERRGRLEFFRLCIGAFRLLGARGSVASEPDLPPNCAAGQSGEDRQDAQGPPRIGGPAHDPWLPRG